MGYFIISVIHLNKFVFNKVILLVLLKNKEFLLYLLLYWW